MTDPEKKFRELLNEHADACWKAGRWGWIDGTSNRRIAIEAACEARDALIAFVMPYLTTQPPSETSATSVAVPLSPSGTGPIAPGSVN